MQKEKAVSSLKDLAALLGRQGITDRKKYSEWSKRHVPDLEDLLWYRQESGMPAVNTLVKPAFHPKLPLMLFNYTNVAHNTLHGFPSGWTDPIRLCRGIVFDLSGNLVALPFPKFFNFGEHEETKNLPDEPFEATAKFDGHLGVIFEYDGQLLLTTRVMFDGPTGQLGNVMLNRYAEKYGWQKSYPGNVTVCAEIVHPNTHVLTDYGQREELVAIGAFDRTTLDDYCHCRLGDLADQLQLSAADVWPGENVADLVEYMRDDTVTNREGFVARFQSGLRVKFKFKTYIGKMVAQKLSYPYLMNRFRTGNLRRMLDTLPEEVMPEALQMLGQIMLCVSDGDTPQQRWRNLYPLVEAGNSYQQGVCRDFVKSLSASAK